MRKIICFTLAAALVLCLSPPVFAADSGLNIQLSFRYTPAEPIYFVTTKTENLPGDQNRLTVTVTERDPDGLPIATTETFMIPNNADRTYKVSDYCVNVDATGNIGVRSYADFLRTGIAVESAETDESVIVGIVETAKNSGVWALSFSVAETYRNSDLLIVPYAVKLNANNANVSGRYDLGEYTLVYDIKGNGSNIKEFKVVLN